MFRVNLKKKLDDKGEMMILVGYHPTEGYKWNNREDVINEL